MSVAKNAVIFILLVFLFIWPQDSSGQVDNKVVAVVNNEVITQQDVNEMLSVLYAQYVHAYKEEELVKKMEDLKKDILRQMIEDKLILSRAKELNIRVTEDEIMEKLDAVKENFPSEGEFFNTLNTQGITVADLKKRYRDQIMMRKIVELEVKSKVDVVPSEISDYYEKHREDYKLNERRRVRHILIKADDNVSFELAKVEAEDIYKKLKNGEDFSEIAKKYSEGPHRDKGGDMGYVSKGVMLPELENAIFSLDKAGISEPVKSNLGYHIFKIEDIKHSGYKDLSEVQKEIKRILIQKKLKKRLEEWIAKLREKAYISIK